MKATLKRIDNLSRPALFVTTFDKNGAMLEELEKDYSSKSSRNRAERAMVESLKAGGFEIVLEVPEIEERYETGPEETHEERVWILSDNDSPAEENGADFYSYEKALSEAKEENETAKAEESRKPKGRKARIEILENWLSEQLGEEGSVRVRSSLVPVGEAKIPAWAATRGIYWKRTPTNFNPGAAAAESLGLIVRLNKGELLIAKESSEDGQEILKREEEGKRAFKSDGSALLARIAELEEELAEARALIEKVKDGLGQETEEQRLKNISALFC